MTQWKSFPKVELHRHLEGAVRLSTIREMAPQAGVILPTDDIRELAKHIQVSTPQKDLKTLLDGFELTRSVLNNTQILERIAFEAVEDAFNEGIYLLELRYSLGFIADRNPHLNYDLIHGAILDGIDRAKRKYPVRVGLISIISRNVGFEAAEKTADFTIANRDTFAGFDLAGDEVAFEAKLFRRYFSKIREKGIRVTVHAGEARVPEAANSVRDAIQYLGAERIGHGLLIIQDPTVVEYVKKQGVVLELCPISNFLTGAIDRPEDHPIRKLMQMGVKVTVNSDDPGLFGTSLTEDYEFLEKYHGFTADDFKQCNQTAEAAGFVK